MRHNITIHPNSQQVSVLLLRDELIYDVHFATNRVARLSHVDNEGKLLKTASSVQTEDPDNDDYLDRLFTAAVANIKSASSWASDKHSRHVSNEIPEDCDSWTFVFRLPLDWRGETHVLAALLHSYVTFYALSQWFLLTSPSAIQASSYSQQAEFTLNEIKCELRKQAPHAPIYTTLY